MLGWLMKLDCAVCRAPVTRNQFVRTRSTPRVAICRACYARWDAAGRVCTACRTPVRGSQEVGIFLERHGLGHADCGGALLAG